MQITDLKSRNSGRQSRCSHHDRAEDGECYPIDIYAKEADGKSKNGQAKQIHISRLTSSPARSLLSQLYHWESAGSNRHCGAGDVAHSPAWAGLPMSKAVAVADL